MVAQKSCGNRLLQGTGPRSKQPERKPPELQKEGAKKKLAGVSAEGPRNPGLSCPPPQ